jgi:hypothetical protein
MSAVLCRATDQTGKDHRGQHGENCTFHVKQSLLLLSVRAGKDRVKSREMSTALKRHRPDNRQSPENRQNRFFPQETQ